jgi:hypothetical protein
MQETAETLGISLIVMEVMARFSALPKYTKKITKL